MNIKKLILKFLSSKKYLLTLLLSLSLLTLVACSEDNNSENELYGQLDISDEISEEDNAVTSLEVEEPPVILIHDIEDEQHTTSTIIVNGVGLAPMYYFFTLDGEGTPTHVSLYPVLTALGLTDISAGSQIAIRTLDGENLMELSIVNYLAFGYDGIIDLSNVGLSDVFMAQNHEIFAPLNLFRELGFIAYYSYGQVHIYSNP
jgi:hypothetical protein